MSNSPVWAETFRRLHLPHYERAGQRWNDAKADGYFCDMDEESRYLQTVLLDVIKKYENQK
jgi:hypothetical protein